MTSRRVLLTGTSAFLLATPLMVLGQKKDRVWRIGYVGGAALDQGSRSFTAFRDELQRLGYIEGRTASFIYKASEGQLEHIPGLVQELVRSNVDVLVAPTVVAIRAAQRATTTIPIVMMSSVDPVAAGFAKSLRQPGGNITGIYSLNTELSAKRMELLKELIPGVSRVAIIWDPDGPGPRARFQEYQAAAKALQLTIQSIEVKAPTPDLEGAFQTVRSNRAQGLIVITNPFMGTLRKAVTGLALQHGLPSITEQRLYAESGGLVSYGLDLDEYPKILASIVARILKGAKPENLPIEQPTKFELAVNTKTAKALGIRIPSEIMVRATHVIE